MKENAPSATANVVARNVVLVACMQSFTGLVPQDAARVSGWFVADFSTSGASFVERSTKRWFQALQCSLERITIPGLALHQALRKRYIERAVRAALDEGFNPLVVLGGGLDSLAVRLHTEFPAATFIELDHPATQRVKTRTLARRRMWHENLKLLPVDFTKQSFEEALNACEDYRAGRATVFLAEGVLMYLSASEVERLFDAVRRPPTGRKRFVFTFMERDEKGRACFRRTTWLAHLWLRSRGEPFKWGLRRKELKDFLLNRGFELKELGTPETFRETYLRELGLAGAVLAEGENVCVADATD